MQNFTYKSTTVLSFRIWIFSVFLIVTVLSILFSGLKYDSIVMGFFALFIGCIVSLPVFIFLLITLDKIFSKGFTWDKIIKKLFLIILIISVVALLFFMWIGEPTIYDAFYCFLLVFISGIIAVVSQIRPIKNICAVRIKEFIIEEPTFI